MFQGGRMTLTLSTPLNIFIGFAAQLIWSRLEDLSFLTINSMISLSIGGMPAVIQAVLIKLIYFDILYTELWLPQFMEKLGFNFDSIADDSPVNVFFEENGFQSKQFLKNSGSTIVYILLYLASWVFLFVLNLFSSSFTRIEKLKTQIEDQLMWNLTFNLILSQFNPILLCSLINLYDLRFSNSTNLSLLSSVSSISLLFVLTLAIIKMFYVTLKGYVGSSNYESITESLKTKSYLYRPLYLVRWTISLVSILTLS